MYKLPFFPLSKQYGNVPLDMEMDKANNNYYKVKLHSVGFLHPLLNARFLLLPGKQPCETKHHQ